MLTGFMGTGKSTVGRLIAQRTDRTFVDTDVVIEATYGPIHQIFDERGEAGFRRLEQDAAAELAARAGLVIATGGRMMLDSPNIRALSGGGYVFTLEAEAVEIHRRIASGDGPRRPLLEVDDPLGRIQALLQERRAGYALFPRIQAGERDPSEVADEIIDLAERGTSVLARGGAVVALGVGEAARWRNHVPDPGSFTIRYADVPSRRLTHLVGPHAERTSPFVVAVGGRPSDSSALHVPTELSTMMSWLTDAPEVGLGIMDVGLVQDDLTGMRALDQHLTAIVDADVVPWSGRSGCHPHLLSWLLDALEAVARDAGFGPV